jgi:hypothetical protein
MTSVHDDEEKPLVPFGAEVVDKPIIELDTPVNIRPDLSEIGIDEVERGVCEDTFENRAILRRAKMGWDTVYASNGVPTGLIQARSENMATQRRILSLAEKKPILSDPSDRNSDYLTGLDLIIESAADHLVPPWVLGATRLWMKEQDTPHPNPKRKPSAKPHRCRTIKDDGIRCMLWSSGRPNDDGMCRVHLRSESRKPGDDIERARQKLQQAAPFAVNLLEELMETAESEPVKLKAATEILDRAGVRGGIEVDTSVNLDVRPAAQVIAERLQRLAVGATEAAAKLAQAGIIVQADEDLKIEDAEIVTDEEDQKEITDGVYKDE